MTMILTMGNSDQVIQFSDRRLSRGSVVDNEESNKCGILVCQNARLAFGFTGLAKFQRFSTLDWVTQALHECGAPTFEAHGIVERFTKKLSEEFLSSQLLRSLSSDQKKLTLMFSGYVYNHRGCNPVYAIVSNYVNLDNYWAYPTSLSEFSVRFFSSPDSVSNPSFVQRVGNWAAIKPREIEALQETISRKPHRDQLLNFGISFVRDLSTRRASGVTIGRQISTICIPSDINRPIETNYHSAVVSRGVFMPAQVLALPEGGYAISNVSIEPVDLDTPPMAVPSVSKNAPCPCGSKIRFKNCHGKKVRQVV
jgi:hypothetical protein